MKNMQRESVVGFVDVREASAPSPSDTAQKKAEELFAALDQSKFTAHHARLYIVVMLAHLTDGLDLLMLGVILPGIVLTFHLSPSKAGLLASCTFVGMTIGATCITYLADRIGRKKALILCIGLYGSLSVAAGLAQHYETLLAIRALQGIGLGAEVPVVLTYILEFVPARRRGASSAGAVSLWQFAGLLAALMAIVIIPLYTWRGMFIAAAILSVVMVLFLTFIPESVRYLAKRGRLEEADLIVRRYSSILPSNAVVPKLRPTIANASLIDILRGRYLRVTLGAWLMCAAWGIAYFGMSVWLPSMLMKMGFSQMHSFGYTAAITGVGAAGVMVSGVLMDIFGRRATMAGGFFIGGVSMMAWGTATTPTGILLFGMLTAFAGTGGVAGCLFTYITEVYPTRFRASGSGLAVLWQRVGGAFAPLVLGVLVGAGGSVLRSFVLLGSTLFVGGLAALLLTYETRGRSLEDITADLTRS